MTKYFVMIEGEQHGPYELQELIEAGVRPSTYVWCKGMADWEKAADVPDICRFFRQHLSGSLPTVKDESDKVQQPTKSADEDPLEGLPIRFRKIIEDSGIDPEEFRVLKPDYSQRPFIPMATAIASTLICFPPTGLVAIYHAYKANKIWNQSESEQSQEEKKELQHTAHDEARQAKMWLGITLSLSLILYSFLLFKL